MDFLKHLADIHNIHLNEQQQNAVINIEGPILLLAVPGGGKTTVIVSRCANMIFNHKINPESILTLTFSRASANDMKQRFLRIFGSDVGNELHFSTIHSFCHSVIKTYTSKMRLTFPTIIEDEKAPVSKSQLLRQIYLKQNQAYLADDKLEELSNAICYVKNMMLSDKEISKYKTGISNFHNIFKNYENYKQQNNFIDFDDMLTKTLDLFKQNDKLLNAYRDKYKYINVDESQDTSFLQHQIIKYLANPQNNIFMVGDEDQSIYTFRAAFPRALLDFQKTYPGAKVLLMENNYRSTKSIVAAANKFIKQNKERYNKNMLTQRDEGTTPQFICVHDKNDQYQHIVAMLQQEPNLAETVVLYRNNASAIPIVDELYCNNIPFYLREAKTHFFKHWVTTDIISFMELAFDPTNTRAFLQIYFKMNAYLSKTMAEYAVNNGDTDHNVFEILLEYPDINDNQKSKLMEIKNNICKICNLKALGAIEFIMDSLNYGEYLKKQSNDESENADSYLQIISGLKSIASKTKSIQDFKDRLVLLQQVMDRAKFNKGKNAVTLSTIHSSKGLEFDKVFMIDLYDGQFPSGSSINGDEALMEEEVRLFYVGATRARQHLELITSSNLDGKKVKPSRFIDQFMNTLEKRVIQEAVTNAKVDLDKYVVVGIESEKDLSVGMTVLHKKFGIGVVRFINPKFDMFEINFNDLGLRTLSLSFCIKGSIVFALDIKKDS